MQFWILTLILCFQVEKPFGKDLASSRELQKALEPNWTEDELFRIDHYLGKEMVKNILILRFGNEFFGATWNRNHIDNVQVGTRRMFFAIKCCSLLRSTTDIV